MLLTARHLRNRSKRSATSLLVFAILIISLSLNNSGYAQAGRIKKLNEERKAEQARESKLEEDRRREEVAELLPIEQPAEDVAELYGQLAESGNRDAVRICYEIAVRAMAAGRNDEAARMLEAAYIRIETNSAGDEAAEKSRSKFHSEEEKDFKGEPYEQLLVYLFHGLQYMKKGDFENARAVFRSGALRDRSAADAPPEEQYHDDMAIFDYLEALCNSKLADPKEEDAYRFAKDKARSTEPFIETRHGFNGVLVFLAGSGPSKYRTGEYQQFLRFLTGNGPHAPLTLEHNGSNLGTVSGPLDNLTFQATTRGDRQVDAILKGKAQFKTGTAVAGDLLMGVGSAAMSMGNNNDSSGAVGALFMIGGLVSKGISASANPEADSRMLVPIADDLYVFPVEAIKGENRFRMTCGETFLIHEEVVQWDGMAPFFVHIVWQSEFGQQLHLMRAAALGNAIAARTEPWQEEWEGSLDGLEDEPSLRLLIDSSAEGEFAGFVEVPISSNLEATLATIPDSARNLSLQQSMPDSRAAELQDFEGAKTLVYPVRGRRDGKQVEFRVAALASGTTEEYLYIGRNQGKKLTGDVFRVSGAEVLPYSTFKLKRSGDKPDTSKSDGMKERGHRK